MKIAPVTVPEWDGPVYVRTLSGADWAMIRSRTIGQPEDVANIHLELWIALVSLCDEQGKRIMQDTDFDAFSQSVTLPQVNVISKAALIHNGMGAAAIDDAKKG